MLSIWTWVMRKLRWVWLLMLVGGGVVAHPGVVMAHPLGNFTINRYSRLEAGRQLKLFYVVDMAEIPTFQERSTIDMNQDGTISADESERYLDGEVAALKRKLHVSVNGSSVTLQTQSVDIAFPAGQGGLQTMRVTAHFLASWPDVAGPLQVEYRDDNFADRIGWQEIVVRDAEGAHFLLQSDVPTQDVSNELRNYPQDLLQNPMTRHSASFRVLPAIATAPSGDGLTQQTSPQLAAASAKQADPFAALIQIPELGIGAVLLALLAAMLWGGLHAFTPGHGKTIVAAYLVGSRGTVRHALLLGLTTTVTHTSGVFALGMVTLFASRFIVPEKLYPWLGVLSGILVVAIGLSLFKNRLVGLLGGGAHDHDHNHNHGHAHDHPHSHDHDHDHDHEHITDHVHDHGDGHGHTHLPLGSEGAPVTWRSLLALGISGGLLPCPSAVVVMLSAIALGRVGFGLVLIIAFSMGLAGVLTTIGVLFVHAGRLINRIQLAQRYPFSTGVIRMAPVLSALFISAAGLAITYEALIQAGLLQGPGIAFPL